MIALTGWANDDAVIVAATELAATLGDDPNHTLAASALDLNGNIYTGENNHHFNGGPCAELVVLGVAASAHAGSLATMVAVGDGGRGVISPCGRCRQVMLDQHPDICVLVPLEDGIQSVSVGELLPFSYVQPDEDPDRLCASAGSTSTTSPLGARRAPSVTGIRSRWGDDLRVRRCRASRLRNDAGRYRLRVPGPLGGSGPVLSGVASRSLPGHAHGSSAHRGALPHLINRASAVSSSCSTSSELGGAQVQCVRNRVSGRRPSRAVRSRRPRS